MRSDSPLNLLERGPYGDRYANFRHYRSVEVKHGRIAMAATLGTLVQENYHFTGYLSPSQNLEFAYVPNGLAALEVVPLLGWVQMAVVIGMHELIVKERPGKAPGDFGTGYSVLLWITSPMHNYEDWLLKSPTDDCEYFRCSIQSCFTYEPNCVPFNFFVVYFFHAVLCWEFSECLQAKIFMVLLYGKQKFSGKQQFTTNNRSTSV